jgi:flavin-dependent dehydrogenase
VIDLLVVGGGPAGLATALHAVAAGLSVQVLEPRRSPVDKACGEGLMPAAVERLRALGVDLQGHEFSGIRYVDGARATVALFRSGTGIGVRRTRLSAALHSRVVDAGVDVIDRAAGTIIQNAASVTAGGITARYLAAADGLHSPIRRQLGLDRPSRRRSRYGLRAHYGITPWSEQVEVYWSPAGEAYVTPVGPDLVGVATLSTTRRTYQDHLDAFPELRERLGAAAPQTSVRGAGPLRQRASTRVAGRVMLVGDAAGYVDAITGEGISLALAEAQALVRSVRDDQPEAYEQRWRRATRSYRVVTEALLFARGPMHLGRVIVPAARRLPHVFETLVDVLAHPR